MQQRPDRKSGHRPPPLVEVDRRGLAGLGLADVALADASGERATVRDRLWIFACAANSDFPHFPAASLGDDSGRGAFFSACPTSSWPNRTKASAIGRLEPPFAQYMVALRPLQRVVWSVVGSGGFTSPEGKTAEVLQLARSGGNFAGVMLDDFFHDKREGKCGTTDGL